MTTRLERFILLGLAILLSIIVLAPLALMFVTSLKPDLQQILVDLGGPAAFWVNPADASLDNYTRVLTNKQAPFLRFLFNSLLIVGLIVVIGVFVNSACAFALSRMRFQGRGWILAIIIALIIIPMETLAIPLFLMMNQVRWIDSYQAQIIPFIAHPFSIFLFYQFFTKLPKDIDEAAYVEGATPFQVYWKVALPLSLPVIATVTILQSLEYWNAYLWPLMVTRGPEYRPVSLALAQFFGQPPYQWGEVMAFSVMMWLPILILYFAFQRWFIQSVVAAAVK
jgi:multiple sugar transport system permease protein